MNINKMSFYSVINMIVQFVYYRYLFLYQSIVVFLTYFRWFFAFIIFVSFFLSRFVQVILMHSGIALCLSLSFLLARAGKISHGKQKKANLHTMLNIVMEFQKQND